MQASRSGASVLVDVIDFREAIVKRSIRDSIADKIAALIASGVLQVGDMLPSERDVAAVLNVSRETIRGAVQILAARGILEVSHGARTRVVKAEVGSVTIGIGKAQAINAYGIEAVHAARLVVERELVTGAARRIDDATLAMLDASLDAQGRVGEDAVRFLICDREFHFMIYAAGGNPLLADFAYDLYAYMMQHRRHAVGQPGAIARSIEDHRAIMHALRLRDPAAAVEAFAAHTERIYVTTRSALGARHADAPGG